MSLTINLNNTKCDKREVSLSEFLSEQFVEYPETLSFRLSTDLKMKITIKARMEHVKTAEYIRRLLSDATEDVIFTS